MARKQKTAPPKVGGVPAWMATFSDLVTLLLTFFVMLMAMASFDESLKMETLMESLREALAAKGSGMGLISMVNGDQLSDNLVKDTLVRPLDAADRDAMKADVSDAAPDLDRNDQEMRISLDERAYFAAGRTDLLPNARSRLRDVGQALAEQDVTIRVEGHTDTEGNEAENWRLSLMRAVRVSEALHVDGGIPMSRLEARGYGPFAPVATYGPDHAQNRRIELVLVADDIPAREALAELQQRLDP